MWDGIRDESLAAIAADRQRLRSACQHLDHPTSRLPKRSRSWCPKNNSPQQGIGSNINRNQEQGNLEQGKESFISFCRGMYRSR